MPRLANLLITATFPMHPMIGGHFRKSGRDRSKKNHGERSVRNLELLGKRH
jgi:hypothetical protein